MFDAGHKTRTFVRSRRYGRTGPQSAPTRAMHELNFLREGHLLDDKIGAFIGRQRFVHPGTLDLGRFGRLRQQQSGDGEEAGQ